MRPRHIQETLLDYPDLADALEKGEKNQEALDTLVDALNLEPENLNLLKQYQHYLKYILYNYIKSLFQHIAAAFLEKMGTR